MSKNLGLRRGLEPLYQTLLVLFPKVNISRPALPDKLLSLVVPYTYVYEGNRSACILSVTAPLWVDGS